MLIRCKNKKKGFSSHAHVTNNAMPKSDDDGLLDVSGLELLFNFMQVQFLCVLIWQGKQGFKVGTTQRGIRKDFSVNCGAFLQN